MSLGLLIFVIGSSLIGCADRDAAAHAAYDTCAVVATSASTYGPGDSIVVSWDCLPGNGHDWVSLVRDGAPSERYVAWAYTGGAVTGSHTFPVDVTGAGTFVARAFLNDSWTQLAQSTPFTVTTPALSLTTDATTYAYGATVVVSWANLSAGPSNYLVVAPEHPTSASDYYTYWYTSGATSGSHTLTMPLPLGRFIVRAFENNSTYLLGESAVATVTGPGGTPTITTDHSTYGATDSVVVSWSALPGYAGDWVQVHRVGTGDTEYLAWSYTSSATSGSRTFPVDALGAGTFVARAYQNNTWTLLAESASFTVDAPAPQVTTDAATYAYTDPITVSWAHLGTGPGDFVLLAPEHPTSISDYVTYAYTSGTSSGSHVFDNDLLPGRYIARAFENNTWSLLADSAVFEVTGAGIEPEVTVDHATYGASDTIVVSWSHFPGYSGDFIELGRQADAPEHYITWFYAGGATSGTRSFPASTFGAGTFVARGHRNNTWEQLDASDPFTVTFPAATIHTDQPSYAYGTPIVVSYANLSAAPHNWLQIGRAGGAYADYIDWHYVTTPSAGSYTFALPLPPGEYAARAFDNDSWSFLAETAFTVTGPGGPTLEAPPIVAPLTTFDVLYAGLPNGASGDWIALAHFGDPDTSYVDWRQAPGGRGTATFGGLPSGRYEVRALVSQHWGPIVARDDFVVPEEVCLAGSMLPLPDGTSCGLGEECFDGLCIASMGTCGDGVRDHVGMDREGCDDGGHTDGDACDATCHPTPLTIAARTGLQDRPTSQVPAVAEDGTGRLLFVWLEERVDGGEPTRDLVGRIYTSAGVRIESIPLLHLEDDVGSSAPIRPSLVGLPTGWAVTWRSTRVEPSATAEQGGIALTIVSREGDLGSRQLVNETTHLDQLDPTIAAFDTGLAIVWSDLSREVSTGDLQLRFASLAGTPLLHEQTVATISDGDQSRAFAVAGGNAAAPSPLWAVGWTTAASAVGSLPEVHMRRFHGQTATDASEVRVVSATGTGAWASEIALAPASGGYFAAWTTRAAAPAGDVATRFIADGDVPITDATITTYPTAATDPRVADTRPAIVALPYVGTGARDYAIVYQSAVGAGGGRLVSSRTLPSEATALQSLIANGQSGFSVLPTERGLWVAWDDTTLTSATDAFVAYLLPWD